MKSLSLKYVVAIFCVLLSITKTNAQWMQILSTAGVSYDLGGVACMTTDNKGNLYVAGEFGYVAKWNDTTWSEVGGLHSSNFNDRTTAIAIDIYGNLYAEGEFIDSNANYFTAEFDGKAWKEIGVNSFFGQKSMISDSKGNVYFSEYSGQKGLSGTWYINKWNGNSWSTLGSKDTINDYNGYGYTFKITTDKKGNVYAAGSFTNGTNSIFIGKHYVAVWNGNVWSELGGYQKSTFNDQINSITTDSNGNVYAAGYFTNDKGKEYVAKWDGKTWSELGGTNQSTFNGLIMNIISDVNDNLYAQGDFYDIDRNHNAQYYIAKYKLTDLPVKVSSINAIQQGKSIQTNWHTSTELNTANFIIQHSTDGSSFTDIGIVKAIGSGANSYSFTDTHPTSGTNYYTLRSVDKDGSSSYSKVVSIQLTVDRLPFTVVPNPARDIVTVKGNHIASVQVIDNIGRVVKTVSLKDATNPTLYVGGLPKGVYHLRVQTTDGKVQGELLLKE